jgi:hypothetical protein
VVHILAQARVAQQNVKDLLMEFEDDVRDHILNIAWEHREANKAGVEMHSARLGVAVNAASFPLSSTAAPSESTTSVPHVAATVPVSSVVPVADSDVTDSAAAAAAVPASGSPDVVPSNAVAVSSALVANESVSSAPRRQRQSSLSKKALTKKKAPSTSKVSARQRTKRTSKAAAAAAAAAIAAQDDKLEAGNHDDIAQGTAANAEGAGPSHNAGGSAGDNPGDNAGNNAEIRDNDTSPTRNAEDNIAGMHIRFVLSQ